MEVNKINNMSEYICRNSECTECDEKVSKEVSYTILNGKVFNTATVCEECGQQLELIINTVDTKSKNN